MHRRRLLVLATLPILMTLLGACHAPPRAEETDRVARVVADAISYPRQADAAGWAYAAQQTRAAQDGRLAVLADHDRPDGTARLLLRVHLESVSDGWNESPAVATCYEQDYDRYGIEASRRAPCPRDAVPVGPLPPPGPTIGGPVPPGFDRTLTTVLRRQPHPASERALREELLRELAADLGGAEGPRVDTTVSGRDIGVALQSDDECLLGARLGSTVRVYAAPAVTVEPGEMSCDARTALGPRLRPPH